jgi:hypothetical protein
MRYAFAIVALATLAASVAGCSAIGAYRVPRDAEPTSEAVEASGDTSVTRSHSTDHLTVRPHGCAAPTPAIGAGLNSCHNTSPRS